MIQTGKSHVLEDDHLPRTLRHRDGEMDLFASAFRPLLMDSRPQHVTIFGESGTGKTCLAKYAVRAFNADLDFPVGLDAVHIDCWDHNSRFQLLYEVVSRIDDFVPSRDSVNRHDLLERMEAYNGPHCVVIIDEAELLQDPHIVRDYHKRDGFSMVLIASGVDDLFSAWPTSEVKRTSGPRITLETYSLTELVDILQDRVDEALRPGAIDTAQLQTIANYAAGDAQEAITMLRVAAFEANAQGERGITDEMIEQAATSAGNVILRDRREKMGPEQQVLYEVVMDADDGLSVSEVFKRYKSRWGGDNYSLKNNYQVRQYLKKLAEYDLIAYSGNTSARRYHRPD